MNGYELSRKWFDFAFENPEKIKPSHTALYFFIIEHSNRLGWKKKFGLPTTMAKDAIGIRSYNTYINTLNDLVDFGFIELIEKSKNQYSSNIVALSNFNKAQYKALDKALIKHSTKQLESTVQSNGSIDKQETINKDKPHLADEAIDFKALLDAYNKLTGKNAKVVNDKTKRQIKARFKEGYTKDDLWEAMVNCSKDPFHIENKYNHFTLEFISRADKLDKYLTAKPIKENLKINDRL
jgi:uncharacterized phage protein (TIGR02220 family)